MLAARDEGLRYAIDEVVLLWLLGIVSDVSLPLQMAECLWKGPNRSDAHDVRHRLQLVFWSSLLLDLIILCYARAQNLSLPRYCARDQNRREGFSSL